MYDDLIEQASKKFSVPQRLIKDVITVESSWNPNAISPTGCMGLLQLSKATAKDFNVTDRANPQQNIMGGTQALSRCLKSMDTTLHALLAYNQGIRGAREMLNGTRPFAEEGKNYMAKFAKMGW